MFTNPPSHKPSIETKLESSKKNPSKNIDEEPIKQGRLPDESIVSNNDPLDNDYEAELNQTDEPK